MVFNVMVDLEMLDTQSSAVIVQIGAVVDDGNYNIISQMQAEVSVHDNLLLGRTVGDSTLAWWDTQSLDALESFNSYITPLATALQQLTNFIPPKARIWANAPTFDLTILRSAYGCCGMDVPWAYWSEHCYRTMKIVHCGRVKLLEKNSHIAVEDASCRMRNLGVMMAAYRSDAPQ